MGWAPNKGKSVLGVLGRSGNWRKLRPTKAALGFGVMGIRLESGRPPSQNRAAYATTHSRIFGCRCYSMVGYLAGIGGGRAGLFDLPFFFPQALLWFARSHFLLYLRPH